METPTKDEIRERIWDRLESEGVARFPFPPQGRIPNFEGARVAAEHVITSRWLDGAQTIKVNPDAPQRYVRIAALKRGLRVLVPTPRLRGGFYLLDPERIPADKHSTAASLSHIETWAETRALDALPRIDGIVTGSVAVTTSGARCGKGEGYSDLEYAILGALGQDPVPIVTTVHPIQIVDAMPAEAHDLTLSAVVTPDEILDTGQPATAPPPIKWERLEPSRLEEMPILRMLRDRME